MKSKSSLYLTKLSMERQELNNRNNKFESKYLNKLIFYLLLNLITELTELIPIALLGVFMRQTIFCMCLSISKYI